MKKTYIIPAIEVIECEAENLIAMSIETGEGEMGGEDALSNKREPEAPWSKSPWE